MFEIHPQLQQDCITLGKLELCHLLLMNDANFPWFILVPEREEVSEIFQLNEQDQQQLLEESSRLAKHISKVFDADKLNIAALGNMVPQLHIHHIVRFRTDVCWPRPVWGQQQARPYSPDELENIRKLMLGLLR
jgi:diadenosine tetraphosphate (Ap4A) HIT family hydrolase